MEFKRIFVTVGTTEFPELIEKLREETTFNFIRKSLKCRELIIQYGHGTLIEFENYSDIKVNQFDLKPDIKEFIKNSDLIISHAGAGTCIDVLSLEKPLLVVINDTLMDNHQTELAEQLSKDGYLFYTTINDLPNSLQNLNVSELREYEPGNLDKFVSYLDNYMGFT